MYIAARRLIFKINKFYFNNTITTKTKKSVIEQKVNNYLLEKKNYYETRQKCSS